jgi:hypothetical protein
MPPYGLKIGTHARTYVSLIRNEQVHAWPRDIEVGVHKQVASLRLRYPHVWRRQPAFFSGTHTSLIDRRPLVTTWPDGRPVTFDLSWPVPRARLALSLFDWSMAPPRDCWTTELINASARCRMLCTHCSVFFLSINIAPYFFFRSTLLTFKKKIALSRSTTLLVFYLSWTMYSIFSKECTSNFLENRLFQSLIEFL